jgi:hypothetical protein
MSKARAAAGSGGALVLAAVALVALVVLAVGAVAAVSPLGTAALLGLAVFAAAASLPVWLLPSVSLWLFALVPVGYLIGVPNYFARFWTPAVLVLAIWVVRIALHRGRGVFLRSLRWTLPLAVLLLALSVVSLSDTRSINWVAILFVTVARRWSPPTTTAPARRCCGRGSRWASCSPSSPCSSPWSRATRWRSTTTSTSTGRCTA